MADAVAVTTIEDGERQLVVQLTNLSDNTGEAKVTKIDVSALAANARGAACNEVRIQEVWAQVFGVATHFRRGAFSEDPVLPRSPAAGAPREAAPDSAGAGKPACRTLERKGPVGRQGSASWTPQTARKWS